ncbi:c-type cytochrome [Primorskyibacter aestuariivivens]|uniref:c-type cytochrome n=1 Tax=Primorskyibacter aestuariivivens TaxID=1888912 RepID=UPI0023010B99|nr:c-type cytochrome [Primorskyibacter aestuariivivens]MDA7427021.1 c-type cytochrome [Primorskyibacter aestuariivivens]
MKQIMARTAVAALFTGFSFIGAASADDAGKGEYMAYCATCHGEAGLGDGPMAEFMSLRVPDLTTITQANDGVFPFLQVVHAIDGRSGVMAHGREMPVWGNRFMTEAGDAMAGDYSHVYEVRGRILSLAYYIESLQK